MFFIDSKHVNLLFLKVCKASKTDLKNVIKFFYRLNSPSLIRFSKFDFNYSIKKSSSLTGIVKISSS